MKRFLSIFIFVFSLTHISAQLFTHFGGTVGFGQSKILGQKSEFEKVKNVQNFSIGLVGEHHFEVPFIVTTEINFIGFGDSLRYTHSVVSNNTTVTVANRYKNMRYYLQVPIAAGLNIPIGDDTRIFIKGGAYYARLIGSRTRGHETWTNGLLSTDSVIDSNSFFPYSKKDFGILASLGYGSDEYSLEVRFSKGLTELFSQAGALPKYNGAFLVTLCGYLPN